jgi:transposase
MDNETIWVGIDLGSESHQVCVVDASRKIALECGVDNTGSALTKLIERLIALAGGNAGRLRVALETSQSAIVEMLLDRGISAFTINPKQLDRFRDRHSVAGAKDDRRDAFVLADSLSTDGPLFKQVKLGTEELVKLRAFSRMRDELLTEINMLSNRIEAELLRCFPEFRALGSVQSDAWLVDLLELASTPAQGKRVRIGQLRVLLKKNRIRKHSAEHVLAVLHGPSVQVAPGVAESCQAHIQMLAPRLRLVRTQERHCSQQLEHLLETLKTPEPDSVAQRDAAIVQSLPGAGTIVSATLLAEAWQALAERDYARLRILSGVAPVTKRSGKTLLVGMRRACNPRLRTGMYHWARNAVLCDERAKQQYARARASGQTHGRALRGVADRLLELLTVLLRRGELFDLTRRVSQAA